MNNEQFSKEIIVFQGRMAPEQGNLIGYGAIIDSLKLAVPIPRQLALISQKRRQYTTEGWLVYTPRHQPKETLYDHLVFALKYEGINLWIFKKLFEQLEPETIEQWINNEPFGQYSRKIWFLYEWVMQKSLSIPDLAEGHYVPLVDEKLQYASPVSINSVRQRIKNNLPGVQGFCPLIHKTPKLENYIAENLSQKTYA